MKLVIFGLAISSAWGNGHATLWRGLCRALHARGHRVVFFEKDAPYYAAHRDMSRPEGCDLRLYTRWAATVAEAVRELGDADAGMVTSYCPDARAAAGVVRDADVLKVFYDLDTPVTLDHLRRGEPVPYVPDRGFEGFDLVLSFTGGAALGELQARLGGRRVAPLYGSVDPAVHRPVPPLERLRSDLSYLGTFAADRQAVLERLFIEPARRRPHRRFVLAGSMYPPDFPWTPNTFYLQHLPPADHPAFYCSSGLTLNITRAPMVAMGHCPSGRLFEAAACGVPIVSDRWAGLDEFFEPGEEIVLAGTTEAALDAIVLSQAKRERIARAARERALACHTAAVRARELEDLLAAAPASLPAAVGG